MPVIIDNLTVEPEPDASQAGSQPQSTAAADRLAQPKHSTPLQPAQVEKALRSLAERFNRIRAA